MKNTLKRLEEFEKELFKEDFRRLSKRNQKCLQKKYLNILSDSMKEYRKVGIKLLSENHQIFWQETKSGGIEIVSKKKYKNIFVLVFGKWIKVRFTK